MTATIVREDKRWSDNRKKMEEEDNLRTLECLRGRLLAERQASRAAKDDAHQMGNKLVQIESKLREESKLRKKAEKKLKFLMKKLESLKISPTLLEEASEQSSLSENLTNHSSTSSTSSATNSAITETEEAESKSKNVIPEMSQDVKGNALSKPNHFMSPSEDSSSSQDISDSSSVHNLKNPLAKSSHESTPISQDSKTDERGSSSLKDSSEEINGRNESDNNEDNCVDNSMALVPVSMPLSEAPTRTSDLKVVNKSVCEVLDALRHAREKIQSSMERRRRHMTRVGPA